MSKKAENSLNKFLKFLFPHEIQNVFLILNFLKIRTQTTFPIHQQKSFQFFNKNNKENSAS